LILTIEREAGHRNSTGFSGENYEIDGELGLGRYLTDRCGEAEFAGKRQHPVVL